MNKHFEKSVDICTNCPNCKTRGGQWVGQAQWGCGELGQKFYEDSKFNPSREIHPQCPLKDDSSGNEMLFFGITVKTSRTTCSQHGKITRAGRDKEQLFDFLYKNCCKENNIKKPVCTFFSIEPNDF